jgi:threonine synthase
MQSLALKMHKTCQHNELREIGLDYDNAVRLIRCQRCGLLMRETFPYTLPATPLKRV